LTLLQQIQHFQQTDNPMTTDIEFFCVSSHLPHIYALGFIQRISEFALTFINNPTLFEQGQIEHTLLSCPPTVLRIRTLRNHQSLMGLNL
jgi:hypothetical protein